MGDMTKILFLACALDFGETTDAITDMG